MDNLYLYNSQHNAEVLKSKPISSYYSVFDLQEEGLAPDRAGFYTGEFFERICLLGSILSHQMELLFEPGKGEPNLSFKQLLQSHDLGGSGKITVE